MKNPREIILSPIITEKTGHLKKINNSYVFEVSYNANKIEIKKAVEKIFAVNVISVNTIRQNGKFKRMGKHAGYRPNWKKAIVTLRTGDSIADFEI